MVKGLAKLGNRLRHDLLVKYVDVSHFGMKRGYSPMTAQFYPQGAQWSRRFAVRRLCPTDPLAFFACRCRNPIA